MTLGLLITFEGPDGSGKSSVLEAVAQEFQKQGREVVITREPGGVPIAEKIRDVILNTAHTEMDEKTELLLYIAARRQHLAERVLPALRDGKVVLMDRFIDSSIAYQGYGRGLSIFDINWLNDYATDGIRPDLTLYFDLDVEIGLERIAKSEDRKADRLDKEGIEWHRRVREGYLSLVEEEPERFVKIDASKSKEAVLADSLAILHDKLEEA